MGQSMKYSILLVIYNHADLTRLCLDSIYKHSRPADFELLILDNASTDGTRPLLRSEMERRGNIRLFFNATNQGFMSPMNFLASQAKGDFLVILNNDIQVCSGWLEKMRDCLDRDKGVALIGIAGNCGAIGPDGRGIPVTRQLEYVEASCMIMPRSIYEAHGLFDDKYYRFGYYEDSDLSLRLRERGYKIATISLPIVHKRASTMNRLAIDIEGIRAKNAELFRQRWSRYIKTRAFDKKVLFRRSSAVGDVIMATPIIAAYKERFPFARITFATRMPWVMEGNPNLEMVLDLAKVNPDPTTFDEFYDLDLAYERRPTMNVMRAYAETAGVNLNGHRPRLYAAKQNGREKNLAVIHAERINGWPGRNAPLPAFFSAAAMLKKNGFRVVEVGMAQSLAGHAEYKSTSFPELCALISSARIFVGHDSAPFHVAQAYGIPAVVPFGAVLPELRDCSGKVFSVQAEGLECLGCHHYQAAPRTTQSCLRGKPLCMDRITGGMMIEKITAALKEAR
jgi:GT2 family glycosyltransferase